jgi:hypothetical protein
VAVRPAGVHTQIAWNRPVGCVQHTGAHSVAHRPTVAGMPRCVVRRRTAVGRRGAQGDVVRVGAFRRSFILVWLGLARFISKFFN